jgi:hypothetical protein
MDEITTRTVVQGGPIRAVIENGKRLMATLPQGAQNRAMRDAFTAALHAWRAEFLKLRFSNYVLRAPFSYRLRSKRYASAKRIAGRPPLVDSGDLAQVAGTGKIVSRATKGNVRGTVSVPSPHAMLPEFARILRTVPHWEIVWISKRFAAELERTIATAQTAHAAMTAERIEVKAVRKLLRANARRLKTATPRRAA